MTTYKIGNEVYTERELRRVIAAQQGEEDAKKAAAKANNLSNRFKGSSRR
ncbi:MAG: hypothetical protein AAF329_24600 [Cyanobacteria bacterium P01_A01_bin.17]